MAKDKRLGALLGAMLVCAANGPAEAHRSGIWKILEQGHFSGSVSNESRVWPIGTIRSGGKTYRLMHFYWEGNSGPGTAMHGQSRLLVFEKTGDKLSYLGCYVTNGGRPRIKGNTVVFPYKEYGNTVVFGEQGPPPKAYLDGEVLDFER